MKNLGIAALVAAIAVLGGQQARAGILAEEDFDYADGPLEGNGGASDGFTGAWFDAFGGDFNVASGQAVKTAASGGDFRDLDFTFGSYSELWVSFDWGVDGDQGTFGGLSFFTTGTENVLIGDRFEQDVWGIAVPSGPFQNTAVSTDGFLTAVAQITINGGGADVINLWVGDNATDPVDTSGTPDSTLGSLTLDGVNRIRISNGSATPTTFDNIVIGEFEADVNSAAIPEPTSLALIGLAGCGLAARRRRA